MTITEIQNHIMMHRPTAAYLGRLEFSNMLNEFKKVAHYPYAGNETVFAGCRIFEVYAETHAGFVVAEEYNVAEKWATAQPEPMLWNCLCGKETNHLKCPFCGNTKEKAESWWLCDCGCRESNPPEFNCLACDGDRKTHEIKTKS